MRLDTLDDAVGSIRQFVRSFYALNASTSTFVYHAGDPAPLLLERQAAGAGGASSSFPVTPGAGGLGPLDQGPAAVQAFFRHVATVSVAFRIRHLLMNYKRICADWCGLALAAAVGVSVAAFMPFRA